MDTNDEALSLDTAAQGLLRPEPEGQPEPEEQDEVVTEVEEQEPEASDDEPEAESGEPEEIEADGDPDEGSDAEAPDDEDEDPVISLPDGSEEKWSDIVAARMRMKDYTQKTMALSEEKKSFESESAQAKEYLQQQYAQLQEHLATFAIAEVQEPDWDKLEGKEYDQARRAYDKEQRQKSEAAEAYRQIQAQQHAETRRREAVELVRAFPEWQDPAVFKKESEELVAVGQAYGMTEAEPNGIVDHRQIRILHDLKRLRAAEEQWKSGAAKVAKRAIRKTKPPGTSPMPANRQDPEKARRQKRDTLLKNKGHLSPQDAVALIMEQ